MRQPANVLRGEVALRLDGRDLVLRPSFAALVAAEEELGPLGALIERAAAGDLRVRDMASLFWHCAQDRPESRADFEADLIAEGLATLLPVYRALLARIFGGPRA